MVKLLSPETRIENPDHNRKSISAIAIRRHIGTLMLTLTVIVLGVFLLFQLQVDLLPSITYPRIGVRVDAPGISPEVAIEEVTKPLEEGLSATEGVTLIYSETREGRVSLNLYFEPGGDIDQALNDATATLNRVRNRLPDTIDEPRLFKFDPSQLPVYEFAIKSDSLNDFQLRILAEEELNRELSVVNGVASVNVSGGVQEEISINVDPRRLEALGLSLQNIIDALQRRNQDVATGRLQDEQGEPLTRIIGRFKNVEEIVNLPLENNLYLRDVAQIIDGKGEQRIFVNLNGQPSIKVSVQKQPDANTIAVVSAVKERIEQFKKTGILLPDLLIVPTLDESIFINNSLSNVISAGLSGTVLAAIAVFLFLGSLRQTFIIIIAIPLASFAAIILMQLFGLSINVFSLGGLALGVGIVVDNSIVMLENIATGISTKDTNLTTLQAAEKSSQQVESALIASTTTNLVAVLPFLFLGGLISLLFNELILTVSFAVAASLLVALTVVPMLASRLLTIRSSSGLSNWWLIRQFDLRFQGLTIIYQKILTQIIRFRIITILLVIIILGFNSWNILGTLPQEIVPQINTGKAVLSAQFPPGTNLETNRKIMEEIDKIILEQPETEYVFTTSGGALFASSTTENLLRGSSDITLKTGTDVQAFVTKLNKKINELNLVNIRIRLFPGRVRGINLSNSPIFGADLDLALQGTDSEKLEKAGRELLKILDEKVSSASFRPNGDSSQDEIQIKPDWERLGQLGLNSRDLGDAIQTAVLGSTPTQLEREQRLIDLKLRLRKQYRGNIQELQQIPLIINNNQTIRLGDVATLTKGKAPGEIQRINQRNVFLIAGNLNENANLSQALNEVNQVLSEFKLPEGVFILPSSTAEANQELQTALQIIGGLATFLVFVVMAVQYNSLIDPLVIILTVPLALSGGIFGLYVTNTPVGAIVLIGAVLLVGIVVNNAIIMVEFANQLKTEYNFNFQKAIVKAASQRLRPILMTTITTVLGLFPLALGIGEGSEFLQPLGVVVFSGLSLATFLTLFIIPCFYVLLHSINRYGLKFGNINFPDKY
jgi:CzcA family heavy metal efflux pump